MMITWRDLPSDPPLERRLTPNVDIGYREPGGELRDVRRGAPLSAEDRAILGGARSR